MKWLGRLMLLLFALAFACVLAAIWMPAHWIQWLLTGAVLVLAAAAISNLMDGMRNVAVQNVTNITTLRD